jgi:polyferredoxin
MIGEEAAIRPYPPRHRRFPAILQAAGDWLRRRQDIVRRVQWGFAALYYPLLFLPALLPQPADRTDIFHTLAGGAEILFWGLWWPGVILSTLLFGQFWCGLFCPDGMLTELASRHGRGGKVPAWARWMGWPLLLFAFVTLYEHLANAHQSPRALIVSLGGASLLALACGFFLGRGKRVWCRYLCPVSGVFSLLARCSFLYFRVDREAWDRASKPLPRGVDCPLLLDVRRLCGNEKCSMCGRCSGHRNAVRLAVRWPGSELAAMRPEEVRIFDAFAVCFILTGLCHAVLYGHSFFDRIPSLSGALFAWTDSAAFFRAPLFRLLLTATFLGTFSALFLLLAARFRLSHAAHLAHALIPLAGLGLFAGTLAHSFALLDEAGFATANMERLLRLACVSLGGLWSFLIARRIFQSWQEHSFLTRGLFATQLAVLWSAYVFST